MHLLRHLVHVTSFLINIHTWPLYNSGIKDKYYMHTLTFSLELGSHKQANKIAHKNSTVVKIFYICNIQNISNWPFNVIFHINTAMVFVDFQICMRAELSAGGIYLKINLIKGQVPIFIRSLVLDFYAISILNWE